MEITVHSTLPVVGGHVTVSADPNNTVDTLITAFCMEKGIPCKREYVIRNRDQQELWNGQKLSSCNLQSGETVFLGLKDTVSEWPCGCNQWWILAFVAFITGAIGLTAISLKRSQESLQPVNYGVVLDAGSSHTKLFVYKWDADKDNGTGIVEQHHVCQAEGPGLSAYEHNPDKAGKSLEHCLDQAKEEIPHADRFRSPVFLGATAGMRLLRDSGQANTTDAILNSVRSTLKKYPFYFNNSLKQARIIDGMEEGSFSWVTVNYVAETFSSVLSQLTTLVSLRGSSHQPSGALDMGGASTQITFIPESPESIKPGYTESLLMFGTSYKVYTHSYLCYGLNEAYRMYLAALVKNQTTGGEGQVVNITSPCHPVGNHTQRLYADIFEAPCTNGSQPDVTNKSITYNFIGQSNNEACGTFVHDHLFQFNSSCVDCSFNNVYQPPLYGNFYAFSGFYINLNFLNVTEGNLGDYVAAIETYCTKTYKELLQYASSEAPSYLVKFCFNNHYIHILLTEGYKFDEDNWKHIYFQDKIQNTELGWSLGFMLNSTNRIPERHQSYSLSMAVFVLLILLFIVFLLVAACFCIQARRVLKNQQITRYQRLQTYGTVSP